MQVSYAKAKKTCMRAYEQHGHSGRNEDRTELPLTKVNPATAASKRPFC